MEIQANSDIANIEQLDKLEKIRILDNLDLLKLICNKLDKSYIPKLQDQLSDNADTKTEKSALKESFENLFGNCPLIKYIGININKDPMERFSEITTEEIVSHINERFKPYRTNNIGDIRHFTQLLEALCHYKLHTRAVEDIEKEKALLMLYEKVKSANKSKKRVKPSNEEIQEELVKIERDLLGRFNKLLKLLLPIFMSEDNAETSRPYFFQEIPEVLNRTKDQLPGKEDLQIHINYLITELLKVSVDLKKPYLGDVQKISSIIQLGQEKLKHNLIMLAEEEKHQLFEGIHNGKEEFALDKTIDTLVSEDTKYVLQDIYNTYSINQALYRKKNDNVDFGDISPEEEANWQEQNEIYQETLRIASSAYADMIFMMYDYVQKEKTESAVFERHIQLIINQLKLILKHLKKMGLYIYKKDRHVIDSRRKKAMITQVPIDEMLSLVDQIKEDKKLILDLKYEFKKILSSEKKYVKSGSLSNLFGYRFDFPNV